MAARNKSTTSTKPKPPAAPDADNRSDLSLSDLARGILSKEIRPRVADIRRLAEAVVSGASARPKKAKAAGEGKKDKTRPDEKGGKKKKNKLARIPGQKSK